MKVCSIHLYLFLPRTFMRIKKFTKICFYLSLIATCFTNNAHCSDGSVELTEELSNKESSINDDNEIEKSADYIQSMSIYDLVKIYFIVYSFIFIGFSVLFAIDKSFFDFLVRNSGLRKARGEVERLQISFRYMHLNDFDSLDKYQKLSKKNLNDIKAFVNEQQKRMKGSSETFRKSYNYISLHLKEKCFFNKHVLGLYNSIKNAKDSEDNIKGKINKYLKTEGITLTGVGDKELDTSTVSLDVRVPLLFLNNKENKLSFFNVLKAFYSVLRDERSNYFLNRYHGLGSSFLKFISESVSSSLYLYIDESYTGNDKAEVLKYLKIKGHATS